MAGNQQEAAVDNEPDGKAPDDPSAQFSSEPASEPSSKRNRARGSLILRVVLAVVAAALLIAAALGAVNLRAVDVYNQATQSLNENLAAFQDDDADLNALALKQQQTDAQFEDASTLRSVLFPQLGASIDNNAAISTALSKSIAAKLEAQHGGEDAAGASPSSNGSSSSSGSGNQSTGSLTDEQRSKIDALLKANRQQGSSSTQRGSTSTDQNSNGDKANKPW